VTLTETLRYKMQCKLRRAKKRLRQSERFRHWRIGRVATGILGPEYVRSRTRIEIDITYLCNLQCVQCNRSLGGDQVPTGERMSLEAIDAFIEDSKRRGVPWEWIRLIGGEPTLHPHFMDILNRLLAFRNSHSPKTVIQVSTNGYGKKVNQVLEQIRVLDVHVINSSKTGNDQPTFTRFNIAPADLSEYDDADFSNGCKIIEQCGFGLSPTGYYPCAVAGSIDRVFEFNVGRDRLPDDDDDMTDMLERFCRLCGHFRRTQWDPGFPQGQSQTWRDAYEKARARSNPKKGADDLVTLSPGERNAP
jgi:hypothetical protein